MARPLKREFYEEIGKKVFSYAVQEKVICHPITALFSRSLGEMLILSLRGQGTAQKFTIFVYQGKKNMGHLKG